MTTLAEDLLLIALDDAKGTTPWRESVLLRYTVAAAMLADLALAGRMELQKKRIAVVDASPTGDDVLDDLLARIQSSKKPHDAAYWVRSLTRTSKRVREQLENRLVTRGVLRREKRRLLWVIESDRFPTLDAAPEGRLREQLRSVLVEGAEPDARTAVLIVLLQRSKLLDRLVTKEESKAARARAKAVASMTPLGSDVGRAVKAAVDAAAGTAAAVAGGVVAAS